MGPEAQQVLGDYRIVEQIGAGGMGKVFLAENIHHSRRCAVKILPEELSRDDSFRARFFDEARGMSDLNHPHIVRVHHTGEDGGTYYLVMDYVCLPDGKSRSVHDELLDSPMGRLAPAKVHRWIRQVTEALAYAHHRGVIHRDIKPANILIDHEGNVRITDFGLVKAVGKEFLLNQIHKTVKTSPAQAWDAKRKSKQHRPGMLHTFELARTIRGDGGGAFSDEMGSASGGSGSRSLFGTYDYMSPELLEGGDASPQSDIYSLGVMTYRMLTGRRPVGLAKPPSTVVRGLSKRWDIIIARCLADNTADRYGNLQEMLADLAQIGRRSRLRVLLPAVLLLVAGASLFAWWNGLRPAGLNDRLWQDWCGAIAWVRPLLPSDSQQRETWQADRQLAAVLTEVETCCAVFDACPELDRTYKDLERAGPALIEKAMAACVLDVTANRDAVAAVRATQGAPDRIRRFFSDPSADTYWPRLAALRQRRDALDAVGCGALCEYLSSLIARFETPESVSAVEFGQSIQRVLYLDGRWPAVSCENVHHDAVARDSRLSGPIQDDSDFLARLAVLPEHRRLTDQALQAVTHEVESARALDRQVRGAVQAAVTLGMEENAERSRRLQQLQSAIEGLDMPLTAGTRDRIEELCRTVQDTALGLDPGPWYSANLRRALDGYYGLDDPLPWLRADAAVTIRRLYGGWEDTSLASGGRADSQVAARIEALRAIEEVPLPGDLSRCTSDPNRQIEAVWAIWRRLGDLPNWPGTPEDWDQEGRLQAALRAGPTALDPARAESLAREIADANGIRERVFRRTMIHKDLLVIRAEGGNDPFLDKLVHQDPSGAKDLADLRGWEAALGRLAAFLRDHEWKTRTPQEFYQDGHRGRTLVDKRTVEPGDIAA